MSEIHTILEKIYLCRSETIKTLTDFIGYTNETFPPALHLFGLSGTGKTSLIRDFLDLHMQANQLFRAAQLNCIECYTTKVLFESILDELIGAEFNDDSIICDSLNDFINILRGWSYLQLHSEYRSSYVIALDNAERLRDMDANIFPSFLRLQELTGLNICVVLISQLPFEKFYNKTGLSEVIPIYMSQYTKADTLRILSGDFELAMELLKTKIVDESQIERLNAITIDFYNNYLNVFLSVFHKACRDMPELKITARKCFNTYVEPVLDGSIAMTDVSRLWRHITNPLKTALAQVYMRLEQPRKQTIESQAQQKEQQQLQQKDPWLSATQTKFDNNIVVEHSVRKMAQSLELPYYGKYLLIAAFLASYNSAKDDKRLFVKNHGKQRKRMQSVNAKAKVTEKMSTSLGPKSFTIDRLLAIFYAILEEKVGLTCNLLSQIQTLIDLKLLCFHSGENNIMEGSARLQCTVGLEFVLYIGKVVGFNVGQYLCDFT